MPGHTHARTHARPRTRPAQPAMRTLAVASRGAVLGAKDTLKIEHTEPGMTHTVVQAELEQLARFVRG